MTPADRARILEWLGSIHPLWELRFSEHRPPPAGQSQRRLLRPVYWLGSWQFACLGYYLPPRWVQDRAVEAEPFPPVLARMARRIEARVHDMFTGRDRPAHWHLNTCLVNFYGSRLEGDHWADSARVGEHKDREAGPVASVSLGERALFQFVADSGRDKSGRGKSVVCQQWLDDGSLQVFGGERWKKHLFHRVQRVDRRAGHELPPEIDGFRTRRVNLTFRYVPDHDVVSYAGLSSSARRDIRSYVVQLAENSPFFARALASTPDPTTE